MNSLGARLLNHPPSASVSTAGTFPLRAFLTPVRGTGRRRWQQVLGGLAALAIQALFLLGLAYGTMRSRTPEGENVTVVNILDEAPVAEAAPPPPPPAISQPAIQLQAPEVMIAEPEPPTNAPAAIVSDTPPAPPMRISDEERARIVAEFQRALQRHLIRHMRYPPGARARREEGIVYVRVAMDRRGYVRSVAIQDASAFPQLDEEGIAVVTRAQPLPVPPELVAGDPVNLIIPVAFSLRTSGRGNRFGGN